ncbi:replication-associated protein [Avian-like circovirus]|uniref:Replication-associated protein n=1 Tax=Avian-like circovirus TaxID=1844928 RepID=A0A172MHN5_9CIRC|nr:replication-associated protein [Avian-like circovirus]ANC97701.1 replication-associated protein [Avian-like circovirus]
MPPVRAAPAKRWCFTLNNPTDEEVQKIKDMNPSEYHYAIVGKERGEQGTPHLQGFLHLKCKKRLNQLKEFLARAHWEKARGSDEDNEAYCSKEGEVILTLGMPAKGNRSDLSGAVAAVKAGRAMSEIAREFSEVYVKYGRGLRDLALLIGQKPRDFKTDVILITGPSGVGKSRWAFEYPGSKFYKMKGEWWDGYANEDVVVIDDFYGWLPFCELLRLTDRYPHKVPVKGSYVEFNSKTIIITSNTHPETWYNEEKCYLQALFRRINKWMFWDAMRFVDAPDCVKKYPINY